MNYYIRNIPPYKDVVFYKEVVPQEVKHVFTFLIHVHPYITFNPAILAHRNMYAICVFYIYVLRVA